METSETTQALERRDFLKLASMGALGAVALAACTDDGGGDDGTTTLAEAAGGGENGDTGLPQIDWEMATSWPTALDTIWGGAVDFQDAVTALTGGNFNIVAREGGALTPGVEVLQNVSAGNVKAGHTASYYYVGLAQVNAFGTALPFGLTYRQQNAWLFEAGGLEMMQEIYAERFNVIQWPAGNTGVQMGGWFRKEINSVADLQGLKMRIPGLGGAVFQRLGVETVTLAGGEIFPALQTGTVDAAEWVGPYDDTKLDFQSVTDFYYYPGWWEPGPSLEVQIPLDEWNNLPEEYQEVIKAAAYRANTTMMARYDALNPAAFQSIQDSGDVEVLPFPDDVMNAAEEAAFELYEENAAADEDFRSVLDHWSAYRSEVQNWHATAELSMLTYESVV